MEILGFILMIAGAAGMAAFGAYTVVAGRMVQAGGAIRLDERRLLQSADLTPRAGQRPSRRETPDPHIAEDLFAELLSFRAEIASMTEELESLRTQVEQQSSVPTT